MTHQQAFFLVSGIIFGLVALFHALRLVFRWQVRLRTQGSQSGCRASGSSPLPGCASGRSGSCCDGSPSA